MLKLSGDIALRTRLNAKRLSDPLYAYPAVFHPQSDWPGDFEGRALLGICSLHHALEGYPAEQSSLQKQADEIAAHLPEAVNAHHYFGPLFNDQTIDEQQLSGNSWFVRGLTAYLQEFHHPEFRKWLADIALNFFDRVAPHFPSYPTSKRSDGDVGGHLLKEENGWHLSSDVGCAYIALDAYSSLAEILGTPEAISSCQKVADCFIKTDYVGLQFQTHATLTATRGILRLYQVTNDLSYREAAETIFHHYLTEGMTYDFENLNWFGRPDTWTEPCCVVDSAILASQLYFLTAKPAYLRLFNRIVQNGIRTSQRDNGGAGCTSCATGDHYELKNHLYEAYFCCTMRLGEGFEKIHSALLKEEKGALLLTIPESCHDEEKGEVLDISFEEDKGIFSAVCSQNRRLLVYWPIGYSFPSSLRVKGDLLEIPLTANKPFRFSFTKEAYLGGGFHFVGDLLQSKKNDEEEFTPLQDSRQLNQPELESFRQQLK